MAKTADRLLEGVKRRAIVPASQPLFTDEDLLALADDVIEELMVPLLKAAREEFFVTSTTQAVTADVRVYDIPYRAVGRGLREIKMTDGSLVRNLSKIALEDEQLYTNSGSNTPRGFYFRGDKLVLVPTPSSSSLSLEIWYELAPSRLVKTDDAALVTGFTATTVTVSVAPDTIATGTVIDFVQGKSGNSTLAMDKTVTNATGTTYTFATGDIPSDLAVGDYVSVAETSPVIQLPNECYPLLETATTRRAMAALGDFEGANVLQKDEDDEAKRLRALIEPRIEGEGTIIINRRGLLRGARSLQRRGFVW